MNNKSLPHYKQAGVQFHPAGENFVFISTNNFATYEVVDVKIANLLIQCQEFKTLDEHVSAYFYKLQSNSVVRSAFYKKLVNLADKGYLVSHDELVRIATDSSEYSSVSNITTIGFPTCDRVDTLHRCIVSYIEAVKGRNRKPSLVIVDDSTHQETIYNYKKRLYSVVGKYNSTISYAGVEDKIIFAKQLASVGDIPIDVINFALLGNKNLNSTTIGANRNSLLLHTVGEALLSSDDDIIWQASEAPNGERGIVFASAGNPIERWFFSNREEAIEFTASSKLDIISLHEKWLGRSPKMSVEDTTDPYTNVKFEGVGPQALYRITSEKSRVALTLNGSAGDCSWDDIHFFLFQYGNTFRRLVQSEESYRSAWTSREMLQSTTQTIITEQADSVVGMCMGLDNKNLLPPFPSVGRAEDVIFGTLLTHCFPNTSIVHLPFVLTHAPLEARTFLTRPVFTVNSNSWLIAYISSFDFGFTSNPPERLRKLGKSLEEIGTISKSSFEGFLRATIFSNMSQTILDLEERLSQERPPAYWVQDAKAYIKQLRESAGAPMEELYEIEGGTETIQLLTRQFGQVLQWWPSIIETARYLRQQGIRLAQPL